MDTNKIREQFEAAYKAYREKMGIMSYTAFHRAREVYVSSATELAWQMWQASREAVVVELTAEYELPPTMDMQALVSAIRQQDIATIEAQGLKVTP